VLQIAGNVRLERLRGTVGRPELTRLASENLALTGSTVARFRITNGRSPAEIIRALATVQLVAVAQPNYLYALQQQAEDTAPASRGDSGPKGDPAQYILDKLQISDVHRLVRGTNVPIAVIDSGIDVTHPELEGAVTKRLDAVGTPEKPHAHGTGMAGAIAAHQRLLGTAPDARLLAVHAFSTTAATPESTTFNVLKGINWSVQEGNWSVQEGAHHQYELRRAEGPFARARALGDVRQRYRSDRRRWQCRAKISPYVSRCLSLPDRGDGNRCRGQAVYRCQSREIYFGRSAGRRHPGAGTRDYQITTGTSVAAAEVRGIGALLLERNPKLTPADIRRILTLSAKRLGPGERDNNFGSGLIEPLKALQLADPRTAASTHSRRRRQQ
jgi:subtilisin family serine protease